MSQLKFLRRKLLALIFALAQVGFVYGQTSTFTYQGRFTDGGTAANGTYDMQFKLFDEAGNQIGSTITNGAVTVVSGVFTVQLDYGAASFPGANRFLELGVRLAGSGDPYTVLSPRQQLTATPYALRSATTTKADTATVADAAIKADSATKADTATKADSATLADTATTATNATQLGGVAASQYVVTTDSRLTDSRPPTAGSGNYIQNANSQQAANFNINGNGTAAGTLSATVVNATTHYNIGGERVLSATDKNLFAGVNAGIANTGLGNTFVGADAGSLNISGNSNAFVGYVAGGSNTTGSGNAFFGYLAGAANTTAGGNSFFGRQAGFRNTTGKSNSFFGVFAGNDNTTGSSNSFFGEAAGVMNLTGEGNSFFGVKTGTKNTTGGNNAFFGNLAGSSNTTAANNSFFGAFAGQQNTTASDNSFFGNLAGKGNTTGLNNSFFGSRAGQANTTGEDNAFFGADAGTNSKGNNNSFFGTKAGEDNNDGAQNSFFGNGAGQNNTGGDVNAFFGEGAGFLNTIGSGNTFLGRVAGISNTTGTNNTLIGISADVLFNNLDHATAIGADAVVGSSNTIVLGRNDGADDVRVPGTLRLVKLGAAGNVSLCRNTFSFHISSCSSSLRYKTNIQPFIGGLEVINRLRPITFDWKQGGMHDVGFGAEEVAAVEPLLVTLNDNGVIEGVKYDRISVALVNAVKEQQEQIKQQQSQINSLKQLVCRRHRRAAACK